MNKIRFSVLMIVLLCVTFAHPAPIYGQATPNPTPVSIRGFHLVSPTEGWVWTDRLYWTKDAGKTWMDITPPNSNKMSMWAVTFVNDHYGRAILGTGNSLDVSPATYAIAQTSDAGKTWSVNPIDLSPAENPIVNLPGRVSIQFLNMQTGWLKIKQLGGSGVDIGILFKTINSGRTWTKLNLPTGENGPTGEPVYFVTEQLGWIVGAPQADGRLYRTQDGGQTWQSQTVGVMPSGTSERDYQLPQFVNPQDGLLTVKNSNDKIGTTLELYLTHDSGVTWHLESTLAGVWPVELVDSAHWIGVFRRQKVVQWIITENAAPVTLTQDPIAAAITDMDFVSSSVAMALSDYQTCPPNAKPGQCVEQRQLLYTSDGGRTWQVLTLPETNLAP